MLQYSVYSVISPEGCASILWKSADKKEVAAEAMGLTADRLFKLELVDEVMPEPLGGAHRNPAGDRRAPQGGADPASRRARATAARQAARRAQRAHRGFGVYSEVATADRAAAMRCRRSATQVDDQRWTCSLAARRIADRSTRRAWSSRSAAASIPPCCAHALVSARRQAGALRCVHVDHGLQPRAREWAGTARAGARLARAIRGARRARAGAPRRVARSRRARGALRAAGAGSASRARCC